MNNVKKIFTVILSALMAVCLASALFFALPKDDTAYAYDVVGPSFSGDKSITFDKPEQYDIRGGAVYGLSGSVLSDIVNYDTVTLEIPSGATSIANEAFFNEDNYGRRVVKVVVPDTVTSIGTKAFQSCQKILHLQIGSNVTSIGEGAFSFCYKLVEIYNRSALTLNIGTTDNGKVAENALNIYTPSSGNSFLARTADNYYFCKYTSNRTRPLAKQTGADVNYTQNRWYLVCGEHVMGKANVLPDPEGGAFAVEYVNRTGTDSISSYDINYRAFWMSYATFVEIPNCVNVIGDYGFGFALNYTIKFKKGGTGTLYIGSQALFMFSSLSVNDPNSPYYDPEMGSDARFGQEIYLTERTISCAADSFYSPVITPTSVHSAIIYPDYSTYNKNRSQINGGNPTVGVRDGGTATIAHYETYLIDVNYNIYDRDNALLETVTEKRLYRGPQTKWGYNYVEGKYGYRSNTAYNDVPNLKDLDTKGKYDYGKTYWYQTAPSGGLGSLATVSWINGLLETAGRTSVDLHMKFIEKPELKMIKEEWEYTGYSYNVENLDELLEGTPIALTSEWDVDAVITHDGTVVDTVKDVGEYVLTLRPNETFKKLYGEWDSEPTVSFKIIKAKVDLANTSNFRLEFASGSGEQLQSGMVYVYREEGGAQVPYTSPQDGKVLDGTHDTIWSYIRNKADMPEIEILSIPVNSFVSTEYMYTADAYSTTPAVNGVGVYNTSVTVAPTANYEFSEPQYSQELAKRSIAFRNNGDGTYTVTKTWYVVAISNWFVVDGTGEEAEDYFTENLEYGSVPAFGAPHLAHGGQDNVRFKLSFTDENNAVTDVTASEPDGGYAAYGDFSKYVNKSMPVGKYALTFKAAEYVDADDGTAYPEFSTTYEFSVASNKKLKNDYSQIIDAALKEKEFRYQYDGNYHLFSGDDIINAVNGVLNTTVNERVDVWANSAYDKYYSDKFAISYNLYRMRKNDYYTEERLAAEGYAPISPDTYTVYYQVTALNYDDMVAVSDDTARREFFFTVFIYDYVEIPYISIATQKGGLVYSGSSVMPVVQGSDKYSINWSNTDVYINAGEHTFNLNMLDSVHYYWKLPAATEGVTAEDINENVTIGFNNDSSQNGNVTIKYRITKAENVWNSTPNVISWAWSSFSPSTNVINAVPRHNSYIKDNVTVNVDVSFVIFYENKTDIAVPQFRTVNGTVTDEDVVEALNSLDAGKYYLVAVAEETDNFFGINAVAEGEAFADEAFFEFNISQAVNRWVDTPNVIRWTWDRFDANEHLITSTPEFGEYIGEGEGRYLKVNYYIYTLGADGRKNFLNFGTEASPQIFFNTDAAGKVPDGVASVLSKLDAGTYYLIANVQPTSNYTGIYAITHTDDGEGEEVTVYPDGMQFAVFKAANRWDKSPSMSGWMWSNLKKDTLVITAEPTYKTKKGGGTVAVTFVLYSLYDAANPSLNVALTKEFALTDGNLPEKIYLADGTEADALEYFNGLSVGNYYLVATVEDGGNFEALSDSATVTVSVFRNGWVYTPSITAWQWSAFIKENNLVTSTPQFNGTDFYTDAAGFAAAQVRYYVYKEADGQKVLADGFEDGFTANADGVITDESVIAKLNALSAGTYYLLATIAGDAVNTVPNYTGINCINPDGSAAEGYTLDFNAFVISKAQNNWATTPTVVNWYYGDFDSDKNTVTSQPRLINPDPSVKVQYVIYSSKKGTSGETVIDESNPLSEIFDGNSISWKSGVVANELPRGTYFVRATYKGNENFDDITNDFSFNIMQAVNSFTVSPNVKQWTWGEYDAAVNKILALPKFYSADDGVIFRVSNSAGATVLEFSVNSNDAIASADAAGTERGEVNLGKVTVSGLNKTVEEVLSELDAGVYILRVIVKTNANKDYTPINDVDAAISGQADDYTFTVRTATNVWVQSPHIAPWNWSDYDAEKYKITALPKYYAKNKPVDVTFTILESGADGYVTLAKFKVADENGADVALDADTGEIDLSKVYVIETHARFTVPEGANAVEYVLGALDAGTYYLLAEVAGTNNYTALNIGGADFVPDYRPFAVLIKTNTWVKNPSVVQWKWGEFSPETNVITALPEFYADTEVTFVIEKLAAEGNSEVKRFGIADPGALGEDGVVDYTKIEGLADALTGLDAGNYRLLVTVNGTGNYTGLNLASPDYFNFSVAKATNTWKQSPAIKSWTWGAFSESVNTVASEPLHGEVKEYRIYDSLRNLLFTVKAEDVSGGAITDGTVIEGLKKLDKGDYFILGIVEGHTNYTDLNVTQPDYIPFEVYRATNEWSTSPNVVNWSYGGYNVDFNKVAAQPNFFESDTITYQLFRDRERTQPLTGQFTVTAEDGVFPSGKISGWTAANLANELDAGTYYLYAEYARSQKDNFTALSGVFEFSVLKATNTWEQTPYIKSWTWGSYSAETNTITSLPKFGKVSTYSVFEKVGEGYTAVEGLSGFTVNDGKPSAEVQELLSKLDAKVYYVIAVVPDGDNWSSLNVGAPDYIPFEVYRAVNEWQISPSVVNWSYGGYNAEFNLVSAQPTLFESDSITYQLFRDRSGADASKLTERFTVKAQNGAFPSAAVSEWISENLANTLNAGTYYLYAEYSKSAKDNFTALSGYFEFSVLTATNTWVQSPSIKSWTWGSYAQATNVITALPKFGAVSEYGIYNSERALEFKIVASDLDAGGVLTNSALVEKFKALDAGAYYILGIVEADGNDTPNYTGLNVNSPDYIVFNVYQAVNEWKTSPTVTAWTYKNYVKDVNTVIALPNLLQSDTIVYTILDKDKKAISAEFTATLAGGAFNAAEIIWQAGKDGNSLGAGIYYLNAKYEGNGNFTALDQNFEFRILKASNSWATTPAVINWYYGGFKADVNTVTSLPRFVTAGDKVVYGIYDAKGNALTAAEGFGADAAAGGEFLNSIVWASGVKPSELPVGTYTLKAKYPASDNYYALETEHEFTILRATNSFKYSPKVVRWTWGGYDPAGNFIAALPEFFAADDVTFTILDGEKNPLQSFGITDKSALAVEDGKLDLSKIADGFNLAEYLKGLNAGEYFLLVSVAGTENYTGINTDGAEDPISFNILQAVNSFVYSPRVTNWTWGEYNSGIYVLPNYFNAADVTFSVLAADKSQKLATFGISSKDALGADGRLDWEEIINFVPAEGISAKTLEELFRSLHAGEYFLLVEVKEDTENRNWSGINILSKDPVSFSVQKAENRWTQSPSIVGWTYGGYVNAVNVITAAPRYSEDASVRIKYQLFAKDGVTAMTREMFAEKSGDGFPAFAIDETDWLKGFDPNKLDVGAYTLKAWYTGCADYTDILTNEFTFNVSTATNTWLLSPKVNSWTWNEYEADRNIISATASVPTNDVTYRVYKLKSGASVPELANLELVGDAFTKAEGNSPVTGEALALLRGLDAGVYYLLATAAAGANGNYTGINLLNADGSAAADGYTLDFLEFEVYAKQNYWVQSPKIVQWAWGDYRAENNLITAEPYLINMSGDAGASTVKGDYVKFYVYDKDYRLVSGLKGFTTASGVVSEEVAKTLFDLPAGTYYLVGSVARDEDGNFTSLDYVDEGLAVPDQSLLRVEFNIGLAANYWMETPNMNSWTWGTFSVTGNAISARPYLINGARTEDGNNDYLGHIEFAVYNSAIFNDDTRVINGFKLIKSGGSWTVSAGTKAEFENLGASDKDYYLVGTVAGAEGKYGEISMPHAFRVHKATNYWSKSPAIDSWTYGAYNPTANAIYASPYYFEGMDDRNIAAQSKVKFTVYVTYNGADAEGNVKAENAALHGFTLSQNPAGLWVVGENVRQAFVALDAGNYVLVSEVEGTPNFTGLSETESFTVKKVENGWNTAPRISFWYYGQFNEVNNAISASPNFPAEGAQVKYALCDGEGKKLAEFTHAAGTVTYTKEVAEIMKGLDRGTYRLYASVEGSTNFSAIEDYYVDFEVAQAINGWNLSPKIVSWTYGGFDGDYNLISSTPQYLPANSQIIYTVYGSKDGAVDTDNVVAEFYYNRSGAVQYNLITDASGNSIVNGVFAAFGALDAGSYYLLARVPAEKGGAGNWSGINEENPVYIEFEIAQADNYWEVSPIIIPWQYGQYSKTANAISAQPHFYEGDEFDPASITFSVYAKNYTAGGENKPITGLAGFRLELVDGKWVVSDAVMSRLNNLSTTVDYFLEGVAEGAQNYKRLVSVNSFRVQKLQNFWTVSPSVSSWTWSPDTKITSDVISALPGRGVPKFFVQTRDEYTPGIEQTYTNVKGLENGFSSIQEPSQTENPAGGVYLVKDVIARLNTGTYYLYVVVEGSDDYTEMTQRVSFQVIQAQNYWDKSPSVSSWTWDGEDRVNLDPANLISAEPHFGKGVNVSIYRGDTKLTFNDGEKEADSFLFDGTVPEYVISALKKLDAGNYSLETSVSADENGNWSGIAAAKVSFTVTAATNYFVSTPNIVRWTYSGYDKNINVVTAEPYFKLDGKQVTYRIYYLNSENERVYVTSEFSTEENGAIPDAAWGRNDPNKLNAGADRIYYLLASYEGNGDNFAPISTTVSFYVIAAQNFWEETPNIMDWTYNVAGNANSPSATPKFGNAKDVVFGYYVYDSSAADYMGEKLDGAPSAAGRYVLRATLAADADGNYSALDSYVIFNVNVAQNYWVVQPNVRAWSWNGFDRNVNTLSAQPYIGNVHFRICTLTGGKYVPIVFEGYDSGIIFGDETDNSAFVVDGSGRVPEALTEALNNLPAGSYYLIATVLSDGNYTGINNQTSGGAGAYLDPVRFDVAKATDRWTVQPQVSGWTYGNDPASLSGIAKAEADYAGGAVTFRYFKATVNSSGVANMVNGKYEIDNTIPGNVDGFADMSAFLADGRIPVGAYVVQASTEGSSDYTSLETQLVFYVAKAHNNWTAPPSINTWVAGNYDPDKNAVSATARFGSVSIEIRNAAGEIFALISDKTTLNNLDRAPAGNYTLTATVAESGNYYGLESVITFTVFTDDQTLTRNYWVVTPNIQGWTYGDTPSKYVGVAKYGTVTFTFKNAAGEILADQNPASFLAGKYILEVKATPSASELAHELVESIEFTVAERQLKVNGWIVLPTIGNWVEGEEGSAPTAQAKAGEVEYVYLDANGNVLASKPTQAGSYRLKVTVNAEGYEELTATISFVIESNEADMLMFVDVILGGIALVLCLLVSVLYIIRRKRI